MHDRLKPHRWIAPECTLPLIRPAFYIPLHPPPDQSSFLLSELDLVPPVWIRISSSSWYSGGAGLFAVRVAVSSNSCAAALLLPPEDPPRLRAVSLELLNSTTSLCITEQKRSNRHQEEAHSGTSVYSQGRVTSRYGHCCRSHLIVTVVHQGHMTLILGSLSALYEA